MGAGTKPWAFYNEIKKIYRKRISVSVRACRPQNQIKYFFPLKKKKRKNKTKKYSTRFFTSLHPFQPSIHSLTVSCVYICTTCRY